MDSMRRELEEAKNTEDRLRMELAEKDRALASMQTPCAPALESEAENSDRARFGSPAHRLHTRVPLQLKASKELSEPFSAGPYSADRKAVPRQKKLNKAKAATKKTGQYTAKQRNMRPVWPAVYHSMCL